MGVSVELAIVVVLVVLATAAAAGANNEVSNKMNGITKIKTTTVNLLLFNTYV